MKARRFEVWKFPVDVTDYFSVDMPAGSLLLSCQMQHDRPCLWALVDPEAVTVTRDFRLAGTGHSIAPPEPGYRLAYVDTFQVSGGALIFHLFEITEGPPIATT